MIKISAINFLLRHITYIIINILSIIVYFIEFI